MKIRIEVQAQGADLSPEAQEQLLRDLRTEVSWAVERHPIEVTELLVESPRCDQPTPLPDDGLPPPVDLPPVEITPRRVDTLPLGVRALNCLYKAGIHDLSQLVQQRQSDLLKLPHMGRKSVLEVVNVLKDLHLSLRPEWLEEHDKVDPR
jgi:Bacterial RNA polymerase, alpha chain C terminal domain